MKDDIRKDSATAQFGVIRLIISVATYMDANLGFVDISGVYMQSGPIRRTIYVRPLVLHIWSVYRAAHRVNGTAVREELYGSCWSCRIGLMRQADNGNWLLSHG